MSRWVAVQNTASTVPLPRYDVSMFYWRPDREFKDWDALPEEFKRLAKLSKKGGSLYMVYATVEIPELEGVEIEVPDVGVFTGPVIDGHSRCMEIDKDNLSRAYGKNAALGKLRQKLYHGGWALIELPDEEHD